MSIVSAIFDLLNWAKDKLPIPNRLESIKNDIARFEKERTDLLNGPATLKASQRIIWIDARLKLLNTRMQNACESK